MVCKSVLVANPVQDKYALEKIQDVGNVDWQGVP